MEQKQSLPRSELAFDYSLNEFAFLAENKLLVNNGAPIPVDLFHHLQYGVLNSDNAADVNSLNDLSPGLRFVKDTEELIDSGGLSYQGTANQVFVTKEPIRQAWAYFEVFCNFTGSRNTNCRIIGSDGKKSDSLRVNVQGPTTVGVLLDYSASKLQILDTLKQKALYTHTFNFNDHKPPLKFQFEANYDIYVNPHAVFEEEDGTVLNQQIFGPNMIPLLNEALPLNTVRVLKKTQFQELSEEEKKNMVVADLDGGSKLVSTQDQELLKKLGNSYEGLYTEIAYDFSRLLMQPLLRVVYPKPENVEETEGQLENVQVTLNKIHEAITKESAFEEAKTTQTGRFFSNPCADALTAVSDTVFRLFPKIFVNSHEEQAFQSNFESYPKIVKGFLIKDKTQRTQFEISCSSFFKQMTVLSGYLRELHRYGFKSGLFDLASSILDSLTFKRSGEKVQVEGRFIELTGLVSLLLASCYYELKSKLKSHGGLSTLSQKFKKKAAHDEAIEVKSDEEEQIDFGGLFDDNSEEDFDDKEEKEKEKQEELAKKHQAETKKEEQVKKEEGKKEETKKEETKKEETKKEEEVKKEETKPKFSLFEETDCPGVLIYLEALKTALIMDEELHCISSQSPDLHKEFWPLLSRPHSVSSTYSSLTFNKGDSSPAQNLLLQLGHTYVGGQDISGCFVGAVQNPRKCVYPFIPETPRIKSEPALAASAYPLVSLLREYTCVPLGISVAHYPAIKFPSRVTHIRPAKNFPLFAVATQEAELYLLFSIFKLVGPHKVKALEYTIFEEKDGESKHQEVAPSQGDSGVEDEVASQDGNSEGMFGNLFQEDKTYYEPEDTRENITKTLEGAEIVDLAPLLTVQNIFFLVLARQGEEYRLLAHLLVDRNTESCNSAFTYDIKKYHFDHTQSLCSAPLPLTPGGWEISGTELTEKDQIRVFLSAGPDKHAEISLLSALKRENNTSLLKLIDTKLSQESVDSTVKNQLDLKKKFDSPFAVQDFTTRDVVLSNGSTQIRRQRMQEGKGEDLALALIENNHVEDALSSWPSELCHPQPLEVGGEGVVKLPEGTVSASVNVFFQMKNVKNLDGFMKPVLPLSVRELKALPSKQIPMELVNLSDQPSIALRQSYHYSYGGVVKSGQKQQNQDIRIDACHQNKVKIIMRTVSGKAAVCTQIEVRGALKIKKCSVKIAAGSTLQELIDVNYTYSNQAPHGPEVIEAVPDVTDTQVSVFQLDKPVIGQYFALQITNSSSNNIIQQTNLRGIELLDLQDNYSSRPSFDTKHTISSDNFTQSLPLRQWTSLHNFDVGFATAHIPVSGSQFKFQVSTETKNTLAKPFAFQVVAYKGVPELNHLRQNLLHQDTDIFKKQVERAKEGDFDALRVLSRVLVYNRDVSLSELNWKDLIKLAICRSEGAEDIFHLLMVSRTLFKGNEEDYNKELRGLLLETIQTQKLHRAQENVSLFGLQFACKLALSLEVDLDLASLISEYYESLYYQLAIKGEDERKAVKQLTTLLPQIQESLTYDPSEDYKKLNEGELALEEARVVTQLITKFEACLKTGVNALIKKEDAFYFSGEFMKPGSKFVTFNIHDLTKNLTIGFTSHFASVFYRLGGRVRRTPNLGAVEKKLEELNKGSLDALSLARQLIQAQILTDTLIPLIHKKMETHQFQSFFMELKNKTSSLLEIPYFRKTLISLLGTSQKGLTIQLAGNMLESLRIPFNKGKESELMNKEADAAQRQKRELQLRKQQKKMLGQMQGTIKMLESVQLKAAFIIGYMSEVLGDAANQQHLWLRYNFIWLAGCLKVLLRCDFSLPSEREKLVLDRTASQLTDEGEIEYTIKSKEILLQNNKQSITNQFSSLLQRVENALSITHWEERTKKGQNLDDENLRVIINLIVRLSCKTIEQGHFNKTALPGSLQGVCIRMLALDKKGESRELFSLLQGNSRNEGSNKNFPAYKVIEYFTTNIEKNVTSNASAQEYVFNLRFLARFLNIYDANLTRTFSNALPSILKNEHLKNSKDLISWLVTFFQKTSYYIPVNEHQNIADFTTHVISEPQLIQASDQFSLVNLMTGMSGYDQNNPDMKENFKNKVVEQMMTLFKNGRVQDMEMLQIFKHYMNNCSLYQKDFIRMQKLLLIYVLPTLRKWSLEEPASAEKEPSALIQFVGWMSSRIFQVKEVDMMCDTMFREWSKEDLDAMVKNMVDYLLLNPHTKWKQSGEGSILAQKTVFFNDMLLRFFLFYSIKREFRQRALKCIIEAVNSIDTALFDPRFSIKLAIQISKHVNHLIGSVIKLCLSDEEDVQYFIKELNGLDFLKNRLKLGHNKEEAPEEEEKELTLTDFIGDWEPTKELPNITNTLKSNPMHTNTDVLRNMINLDGKFVKTQIDEKVLSDDIAKLLKTSGSGAPKGWYTKTSHFNSDTNHYSLSYNCQYFFEFTEPVELTSIAIGLQSEFNNGARPIPEYITFYYGHGGADTAHLYSCRLPRVYDYRFQKNNVFGTHFHSLNGGLPGCLDRAKGLRVKYIGFTMDGGWFTGFEESMKASILTNSYSDNIRFIKANGFTLKGVGNYLKKISKDAAKCTLDLVAQIGSEMYARRWAEMLCELMPFQDGNLMRSYLLEPRKVENKETGNKNEAFFRFITILAEKSPLHVLHFSEMVFSVLKAGESPSSKLEKFFLNLCLNLGESDEIKQIEEQLVKLIVVDEHGPANRVAKLLLKYIHRKAKRAAENKEEKGSKVVRLPALSLERVVQIAENVINPGTSDKDLENLVKFVIYPPPNIQLSFTQSDLLKALQESQKTGSKTLIEIINMGDLDLSTAAYQSVKESLLEKVEKLLETRKDSDAVLAGLLSWSRHPTLRNKLAKTGLGVKVLSLCKKYVTEKFSDAMLDSLLQVIQRLIYGYPALEEEVSKLVDEDKELFGNDEHSPDQQRFYNSIIFPLLFGEEAITVCFNPFFSRDGMRHYLSLYEHSSVKKESEDKHKQDAPFKLTNFPQEYKKPFASNMLRIFGTSQLAVLHNYNIGSFEGKFTMGQLSLYSPAFVYGQADDSKTSNSYFFGLFSLTFSDTLFYERLKDQGFSSVSMMWLYCRNTGEKLHFKWKDTGMGQRMIHKYNNDYCIGTKDNHFVKFEVKDYSNAGQVIFPKSKPDLSKLNLYCCEGEDAFQNFQWPQEARPPLFYAGLNTPYYGNANANISKFFTGKYDFIPTFFRQDAEGSPEEGVTLFNTGSVELLDHPWHHKFASLNKLNPLWNVPIGAPIDFVTLQIFGSVQKACVEEKGMTFKQLSERVMEKEGVSSLLSLDIDIDVGKALGMKEETQEEESKKEDVSKSKPGYIPQMGVFDCFSKSAGFHKIALVVKNKVEALSPATKQDEAYPRLQQWLREVEDFSQFPQFDTIFLGNTDCREFILQDVIRSSAVMAKFRLKEAKIANAPFETLGQLFRGSGVGTLRSFAFENKLVSKLIDALQGMTHETKRYKIGDEELRKIEEGLAEERAAEAAEVDVLPVFEVPEQDNTKKKKRKGVGYSSSEGKVWDVNAFLQSRERKNERVASLVDLLVSLLDTDEWHPDASHMEQLYCSALLPFLENMFSACSLVEMAKDYVLFVAVFRFIRIILKHETTIQLLLPLDTHYRPAQRVSLLELMKKLNGLAQIFLSVNAKKKSEGGDDKAETLAKTIDSLFTDSRKQVEKLGSSATDEAAMIRNALKLPIRKSYPALLGELRFDYMDIPKDGSNYKHYFASQAQGETNPPATKMIRLAQELADLSNALPIDYTNAMFIRVDRERIDLMKAVICGANGTPYAHGIFEYDLYLPNNYPNTNPKCNLMTTGNQQVRFNPNLYSNGYVCLSLLGTWRGNANENWDPKLSTILQLLLSIQAVVMSEEVYFNEPGYENTAGTPDGERKNEGYMNIVRYCNIKFAMVEMMEKPIKGFEEVIHRHFYLKREQVMNEVGHWIKLSEKNQADYNGLVSSHNWSWCDKFKKTKDAYRVALKEIVDQLDKQLKALDPPSIREMKDADSKSKDKAAQRAKLDFRKDAEKLEDVDVAYEEQEAKEGTLDVDDEKVKDRWSRYIGAMGVDAVAKQAAANVMVCGAGGVGIEIAKNIVLAGCKTFYLWDDNKASQADLASQFFLSHKNIGQNRATASHMKLQQLNFYVKVRAIDGSEKALEGGLLDELKPDVIVLTDPRSNAQIAEINEWCRKNEKKFIVSDVYGLGARIFTDFGGKFEVLDKNGEELQDVLLKEIREATEEEVKKEEDQKTRPTVAVCLTGARHNFEDGDEILLQEVIGLEKKEVKEGDENKGANGEIFKVKVINPEKFILQNLDLSQYSAYERNGLAKQLKQKVTLQFEPYAEAVKSKKYDGNLWISDFEKMGHWDTMHLAFQQVLDFKKGSARLLTEKDSQDQFIKRVQTVAKQADVELNESVLSGFTVSAGGEVNPICAFLGGFTAQQIVKAITGKFTPVQQWFYFNALELLPAQPKLPPPKKEGEEESKEENKEVKLTEEEKADAALAPIEFYRKKVTPNLKNTRADGLRLSVGDALAEKVANVKLFMVGSGAIGCELLKNYAMLGIGSGEKGMIVLTDPDHIEVSNLNRQFLFREKHLRKPKASTAAAAAIDMNPEIKGRVYARLDKVHPGTDHIYTDKFFEDLTLVTNALDNIAARRYVDSRCVSARTPLLESGTLGPKGHVQVVVPNKTESYGSQADPENTTDIPQCTLKMFPEETLHCVEWARDKFEKLFTQQPKQLAKVLEPDFKVADTTDATALKKALKMLQKRPATWEDCVAKARHKFQKYFVNDILQLLYAYPLEKINKDGRPFWSSPKRPPHEAKFDPEKEGLHVAFILATAILYARMYGVKDKPKEDLRKQEKTRVAIAVEAQKIKVAEFKADKKKAEAIAKEVEAEEDKKDGKDEKKEEEEEEEKVKDVETLLKELTEAKKNLPSDFKPNEEVFEKDDDENGHIDFIHALANCRASNYKLEPMDWINVKLKAGRIVPALATTTAAVAGLQTLELLKLVAGCRLQDLRNAFLNLALPQMTASEPGPPESTELREGLTVNLWDRWDVFNETSKENITLGELMSGLESQTKLHVRDVMRGNKPLFFYALMSAPGKEQDREKKMKEKMRDLLDLDNPVEEEYSDLTVTFAKNKEDKDILKGVPPVRVRFIAKQ